MTLADAAERVSRASTAAVRGAAGTRALIFLGAVDPFAAVREAGDRATGVHLRVDCAAGGLDSLAPLRPLIDAVLPELREHVPDLVERFAPEMSALHPRRADDFDLPKERWLSHLANTPSERRCHRESEMLFRIVNGLAKLLHQASQAVPAWGEGPVVIVWRDLHRADAATLLAFRRLARWAHQGRSRLVLVANLAVPAEPGPDAGRRFDHSGHHRRLLARVREQFLGTEYAVTGDWPETPWPVVDTGPHPVADALAMLAGAGGDVEQGCARAVRAMAPAAFTLNYPAVLRLAEGVVTALDAAAGFDQPTFDAEWDRIEPEEYYPALEFAVIRPAGRDALRAVAWRAAGFANTCLDAHEIALECYHENLALAGTPERRAEGRMYLALITGKRLRRIPEAEEHLRLGLAEIDGRTDEPSLLEKCWLLNVGALMAFQQRQHDRAMKMVRQAREVMRPLRSSEATHLKVNLISNISVLLEETGRAEKAAELWQYFTAFLSAANELFAKHYYFREGGLRLAAGRVAEAAQSYQASLRQAEAIDDPFHAAIVAGTCGYLAYQEGDFAVAAGWYERSAEASRAAGDHEELSRALATVAFVRGRAGDVAGRAAALDAAAWADEAAGGPHTGLLDAVRTDGETPAEEALVRFAGTKLNRPFHLVNTYRTSEG